MASEVNLSPSTACDTSLGNGKRPSRCIEASVDINTIPVTFIARPYIYSYLLYILNAVENNNNPVPLVNVMLPMGTDISINEEDARIVLVPATTVEYNIWARPDTKCCSSTG